MMKYIFGLFILFFSLTAPGATEKFSSLPLGSAAGTATNDSFPYVDSVGGGTKRLLLSDLPNVSAIAKLKGGRFNAQYYGADPTGAADSTTAIQNCVTAAQNAGGACYLPPSSAGYKITNTITVSNDCAIEGDSMTYSSSAFNGATVFFSGSNAVPMFLIDNNAASFRMSNLSLKNTGSATMAVQINRVNALFENISSNSGTGFSTAIFSSYQAGGGYAYHTVFRNLLLANQSISSQTPIGILYAGGNTFVLEDSYFSGFSVAAVKLESSTMFGGTSGATITNNHIESFCGDNPGYPGSHTAVGIYVDGPVYGSNITGNQFEMDGEGLSCGSGQRAITFHGAYGAQVAGNNFYGTGQGYAISLATATVNGINIEGNQFFDQPVVEILNGSAGFHIGVNDYNSGSPPSSYDSSYTASRALIADSSKNTVTSATSKTQLEYLSSATGTTGSTSSNLMFSDSPTLSTTTNRYQTLNSTNVQGGISLYQTSGSSIGLIGSDLIIGNGVNTDFSIGAVNSARLYSNNGSGGHYFGVDSSGLFKWNSGGSSIATLSTAGLFSTTGDLKLTTAGTGFYLKEGTNATMGTGTLNGSTEVTISTTKVTANSRIFLTIQAPGGTPAGAIYVSSRSAGTSFGVKGVAGDTSTFAWMIVEPD